LEELGLENVQLQPDGSVVLNDGTVLFGAEGADGSGRESPVNLDKVLANIDGASSLTSLGCKSAGSMNGREFSSSELRRRLDYEMSEKTALKEKLSNMKGKLGHSAEDAKKEVARLQSELGVVRKTNQELRMQIHHMKEAASVQNKAQSSQYKAMYEELVKNSEAVARQQQEHVEQASNNMRAVSESLGQTAATRDEVRKELSGDFERQQSLRELAHQRFLSNLQGQHDQVLMQKKAEAKRFLDDFNAFKKARDERLHQCEKELVALHKHCMDLGAVLKLVHAQEVPMLQAQAGFGATGGLGNSEHPQRTYGSDAFILLPSASRVMQGALIRTHNALATPCPTRQQYPHLYRLLRFQGGKERAVMGFADDREGTAEFQYLTLDHSQDRDMMSRSRGGAGRPGSPTHYSSNQHGGDLCAGPSSPMFRSMSSGTYFGSTGGVDNLGGSGAFSGTAASSLRKSRQRSSPTNAGRKQRPFSASAATSKWKGKGKPPPIHTNDGAWGDVEGGSRAVSPSEAHTSRPNSAAPRFCSRLGNSSKNRPRLDNSCDDQDEDILPCAQEDIQQYTLKELHAMPPEELANFADKLQSYVNGTFRKKMEARLFQELAVDENIQAWRQLQDEKQAMERKWKEEAQKHRELRIAFHSNERALAKLKTAAKLNKSGRNRNNLLLPRSIGRGSPTRK